MRACVCACVVCGCLQEAPEVMYHKGRVCEALAGVEAKAQDVLASFTRYGLPGRTPALDARGPTLTTTLASSLLFVLAFRPCFSSLLFVLAFRPCFSSLLRPSAPSREWCFHCGVPGSLCAGSRTYGRKTRMYVYRACLARVPDTLEGGAVEEGLSRAPICVPLPPVRVSVLTCVRSCSPSSFEKTMCRCGRATSPTPSQARAQLRLSPPPPPLPRPPLTPRAWRRKRRRRVVCLASDWTAHWICAASGTKSRG
jgi:hypothetical protein